MSNVLLIQNTRSEGSGYLGDLLKQDGFKITSIQAKTDNIPEPNFDFVVILGAPESANDDLPYLQEEQKLIKDCVEKEIPILGICLGSQLIAKTFGAKVYRGPRTEIGFYSDLTISDKSPFFSGFEDPFTVFHWHSDTFDLPTDATRLASSKYYQNQAFQYKSAIGLQFHLEVNEQMVNLWLDNTEQKQPKNSNLNFDKTRSEIEKSIPAVKSNMKCFYKNFVSAFNL